MKKKRSSRIVTIFTRIFNVRAWADLDRIKAFTLYLLNGFKKMFVPQKTVAKETFEEAMLRMNISETEIQSRSTALYRLSLIMCVAAVGIFGYALYHLYFGQIKGFVVSLVVTIIALALAFRYHFWYYQIRERKLGCTMQEWYKKGLLGEK